MTTHAQARDIVRKVVLDPADAELVQVLGLIESHYGDGWKGSGEGSNNWGAITAGSSWKGNTFTHRDSRWNPATGRQESYETQFRSYDSPLDGVGDLYAVLQRNHPESLRLAREGRWGDVSRSLGPLGSRYYLGHGSPEASTAAHRTRLLTALDEMRGHRTSLAGPAVLLLVAALMRRR